MRVDRSRFQQGGNAPSSATVTFDRPPMVRAGTSTDNGVLAHRDGRRRCSIIRCKRHVEKHADQKHNRSCGEATSGVWRLRGGPTESAARGRWCSHTGPSCFSSMACVGHYKDSATPRASARSGPGPSGGGRGEFLRIGEFEIELLSGGRFKGSVLDPNHHVVANIRGIVTPRGIRGTFRATSTGERGRFSRTAPNREDFKATYRKLLATGAAVSR
jgi:hypothetical protein